MTWRLDSTTGALGAGVMLGIVYTLSPLTVLCLTALVLVTWWASRDLQGRERHWFLIIFSTAILLRIVMVGGLILSAGPERPYTVFFGDEWIFKSRPVWLRNVGLGIPISAADFIYAYDETGMSGHLYALAFLQALVGEAPYGVHLFNVMLYVGSVVLLYRLVRRSFGMMPALCGSTVLLFLPSLFGWSISALKEPIYISLSIVEVLLVLAVVRAGAVGTRIAAAAGVIVLGLAMEEVRKGTLIVVALGTVAGLGGGWLLQKPRRALVAAAVLPVLVVAAVMQPSVNQRLLGVARDSIRYHMGHVMSAGVSYQLIDPRYYRRWELVPKIEAREAAQFVVRAAASYVIEPTPRNWQSPMLWAYLPEHLFWLLLIALVPFGILPALRHDRLLTAVLLAHAAAIVMMVALTSGNIGTLIRHRGLSLPYLVWFSMLGLTAWVRRAAPVPPQPAKADLP